MNGISRTVASQLQIKLLDKFGEIINPADSAISLQRDPRSKNSLHAKFYPPNSAFRILMIGKTKSGYIFERLSKPLIVPKSFLVVVVSAGNTFTAKAGRKIKVQLKIKTLYPGKFQMKASAQYGRIRPRSRRVYARRVHLQSFFFSVPRHGIGSKRGNTVHIFIGVKKRRSREKAMVVLPVLVV